MGSILSTKCYETRDDFGTLTYNEMLAKIEEKLGRKPSFFDEQKLKSLKTDGNTKTFYQNEKDSTGKSITVFATGCSRFF